MARSPEKFARLLSQAVHRLALQENRTVKAVQDELGYALGRETGGSSIEYWRKGNVPAQADELEKLAGELWRRGGFAGPEELEQFCRSAGLAWGPAQFPGPGPARPVEQSPLPSAEHPPFIAGPPVGYPRYFFGRERELKRLFELLKHRPLQNGAVIGPRRSGKTSLLHYLKTISLTPPERLRPGQRADWLPNPARYAWIYVDFQDPRLGSRAGLLRYLLQAMPFSRPESRFSPEISLTDFLDLVSSRLDLPTVILFDEIGVALERYAELDNAFWESLRALATNQVGGNLAFILAAAEPPGVLASSGGLGSPFFNIFGYTAMLGPLREAEARELIASSPRPFPLEDVDWILAQSGSWPFLLQILCRERYLALEDGDTGPAWREDGLAQIRPFREMMR